MSLPQTRREAIFKLAAVMGVSLLTPRLGPLAFGAEPAPKEKFSASDLALLDEIGDTLIPPTDVPGAKAVGIGAFMATMISDCYSETDQRAFRAGVETIARDYRARFGEEFVGGAADRRTDFLNEINTALRTAKKGSEDAAKLDHFRILRELTILGYFTSELVNTSVRPWVEVPGRYDGDVKYTKPQHG